MSLKDETILGLTIRAPHGQLIAMGEKTIEGRGWPPYDWMLGKYLAIHQSREWDQSGYDFYNAHPERFVAHIPRREECAAGVIAVAQLVGWVQRTETGAPKTIQMLKGFAFGDNLTPLGQSRDWRWFTRVHEYGWVLRGVVRIEPVAVMGKQKLWKLSSTVYTSVRKRYDAARRSQLDKSGSVTT